jgi:hypothetical protein
MSAFSHRYRCRGRVWFPIDADRQHAFRANCDLRVVGNTQRTALFYRFGWRMLSKLPGRHCSINLFFAYGAPVRHVLPALGPRELFRTLVCKDRLLAARSFAGAFILRWAERRHRLIPRGSAMRFAARRRCRYTSAEPAQFDKFARGQVGWRS